MICPFIEKCNEHRWLSLQLLDITVRINQTGEDLESALYLFVTVVSLLFSIDEFLMHFIAKC